MFEIPKLPGVPTSVLGDVTNTSCATEILSQRLPAGPDHIVATKANQYDVVAAKTSHAPGTPEESRLRKAVHLPCDGGAAKHREMIHDLIIQDDPQHVAEYAPDIFNNLQRGESVHMPSPGYMDKQVQINAKMRAILVDWLVDVHRKYKLHSETLFLTVSLIDQYLELRTTTQRNLQLVGVTAMLIAAKFEEVYPPQIKDLVYVTDKAYSRDDILKMEVSILTALQFKVCRPTAMNFLERYQLISGCTDAHRDLAQYLLELSLVDYKMIKYTPSHLAAASVLLSNKLLRRPAWTPAAVRHTRMTEPMLKECAKEICLLLELAESASLQAVRKKFSQVKHHSIAKLNFMAPPGSSGERSTTARRLSAPSGRRSSGGGNVAMDLS
jgi:cyclin B